MLRKILITWLFVATHLGFSQGHNEKSVNIRVQQAPIFVLSLVEEVSLIDVEVMFRPTQYINLGTVFTSYTERKDNINFRAYDMGLRIDFVFSSVGGFSDAFYLSNAVLMGKWTSEEIVKDQSQNDCSLTHKASGNNVVAGGTFGYQWFWNNGYNINAGLGLIKAKPVGLKVEEQSNCPVKPTIQREHGIFEKPWIDVGLGYSF